jgi:hypothetical protein
VRAECPGHHTCYRRDRSCQCRQPGKGGIPSAELPILVRSSGEALRCSLLCETFDISRGAGTHALFACMRGHLRVVMFGLMECEGSHGFCLEAYAGICAV